MLRQDGTTGFDRDSADACLAQGLQGSRSDYRNIKSHIVARLGHLDHHAARAAELREDMVRFLRDIVAIPSLSRREEAVVRRVAAEMEKVGFDEVVIDPLGNVLGRVGDGPRVIAFDAHLDTVDVTDGEEELARETVRLEPGGAERREQGEHRQD